MAVPKKKISKARGGSRRSHNALAIPSHSVCPNCQEAKLPHHVCANCGWYNDRQVIEKQDI
ncbi:MAG: 50S ribosomal protein L32 [Magnetococcales bacterium]|nr:50S ribosomal protein L32 [Magnetococcales bacterium]